MESKVFQTSFRVGQCSKSELGRTRHCIRGGSSLFLIPQTTLHLISICKLCCTLSSTYINTSNMDPPSECYRHFPRLSHLPAFPLGAFPSTIEQLDAAGLRGEGESPYVLSDWERTTYYNGISPDHPELLYRSKIPSPSPRADTLISLPRPSIEYSTPPSTLSGTLSLPRSASC
jgi:hypothetical protein